jgi:hypothetical protein
MTRSSTRHSSWLPNKRGTSPERTLSSTGGLTSGLSTAFVNQIYQADQEPTGKPHTESGTEA